jgi:hypothetical protein
MGVDVGTVMARRVSEGRLPVGVPLDTHRARLEPVLPVIEAFADDSGMLILDPSELICAEGFCAAHDERTIWYADSNHLSREGAERLIEGFRDELLEFVRDSNASFQSRLFGTVRRSQTLAVKP